MFRVKIYPNTLAPWFSQVYAGLFNLQAEGKVELSIATKIKYPILLDGTSLALDVTDTRKKKTLSLLVDLNDNRGFAVPGVVDWFDVIFKRSYIQTRIDELPECSRNKVIPYGLNFNCGSEAVPILKLFCMHHMLRFRAARKPEQKRHTIKFQHQLRFLFYLVKNNLSLNEQDFVGHPGGPVKNSIFFLTRMFESDGELTKFSEDRIKLVTELKKEFGSRFYGGIVKDSIALRFCPKNLLCSKITRRQFTRTLKESDIAICTLGVGLSNPWKLGEAMAASRCIVSEPLRYELPEPLVNGENMETFVSVDDCLSACDELLHDPKKILHIKNNNWDYYQRHIRSQNLIERMLNKCFQE